MYAHLAFVPPTVYGDNVEIVLACFIRISFCLLATQVCESENVCMFFFICVDLSQHLFM